MPLPEDGQTMFSSVGARRQRSRRDRSQAIVVYPPDVVSCGVERLLEGRKNFGDPPDIPTVLKEAACRKHPIAGVVRLLRHPDNAPGNAAYPPLSTRRTPSHLIGPSGNIRHVAEGWVRVTRDHEASAPSEPERTAPAVHAASSHRAGALARRTSRRRRPDRRPAWQGERVIGGYCHRRAGTCHHPD